MFETSSHSHGVDHDVIAHSHIPMVLDCGCLEFHAYRAKNISGELQSVPWLGPLFRVVRTCRPRQSRGDIPFPHDLVHVEVISSMQDRMNCFVISRALARLAAIVLMTVVGFTLPEKEVLVIRGNNIRSLPRLGDLEPLIRAESSNKAETSCLSPWSTISGCQVRVMLSMLTSFEAPKCDFHVCEISYHPDWDGEEKHLFGRILVRASSGVITPNPTPLPEFEQMMIQ